MALILPLAWETPYVMGAALKRKKKKDYINTMPFKIAPQKVKYLEINLTKEVKDLYAENYKTF